ncbi:MAG: formate acetyltransferase, partial [Deltaproteobacteria bacterium]|nr:formate acetyltransferase [Deltaproteobacteria bacterium]
DNARDATAGGALYNGGGVQGIGPVEVGDSLAAVETVVFQQGRASMAQLVEACRDGFRAAEELQARLREAPKYGNDDPLADGYVGRVMELYAGTLAGEVNTRGGAYAAGFYSVTAHEAFGEVVGALPSGRVRGEPFSSGLSPGRGGVRKGPTAALLSAAHLPVHCAGNGVNFNLQLAPWTVAGESGVAALRGLIDGGFAGGCMQMQVNVMDPAILMEARDNPGSHPELIVRVSGYSAYFDDLSPEMKQEVIDRWVTEDGAAVPK